MWCSACQQDVPGVVTSTEDRTVCCARCGHALTAARDASAGKVPFEELPEFAELSDWDFDETLQEAEHLTRGIAKDACRDPRSAPWRLNRRPELAATNPRAHSDRRGGSMPASDSSNSTASTPWIVLTAALAVFVCGIALISLSLVSQRPLLWQLGVPMALAGQVAVLAIVVWQLNAAWNGHQATFIALHAMDDQVRELRNDWSRIQRSNPDAFYDQLAEGVDPETLLTDLQDRIDVLSDYLDRTERAA